MLVSVAIDASPAGASDSTCWALQAMKRLARKKEQIKTMKGSEDSVSRSILLRDIRFRHVRPRNLFYTELQRRPNGPSLGIHPFICLADVVLRLNQLAIFSDRC